MKIEEFVGVSATFLFVGIVVIQLATFIRVSQESLHSSGQIVAPAELGFYSDQNCTTEVTEIYWGTLEPGDQTNQTVYMRNEGSNSVKTYLTTSNWIPGNASDFITCSWNMEGIVLSKENIVATTFSLYVSEDIQGIESFSFDIIVTFEV